MAELQLTDYGLDRPESGDDVVVPFTLETLDSRGRVVRLGDALDQILTRHNYPAPVARLLGEERPMRFTTVEKKGFFNKLFGG